jgi:DNA-binding transcriptional ArsR family regulator
MTRSLAPPADPVAAEPPLLPDTVPVAMPELPPRLVVTSERQVEAISDPTRSRILVIIQHQPATAKQIAARLGLAPGTVGHHLRTLEAAGLAQVVARRLVRGIVAKYYTRTARLYQFHLPHEVERAKDPALGMLARAGDELADALVLNEPDFLCDTSFPHARLSPERAAEYQARLRRVVDDFVAEPADPGGRVYALCGALFEAPAYLQVAAEPAPPAGESSSGRRPPTARAATPTPPAPPAGEPSAGRRDRPRARDE